MQKSKTKIDKILVIETIDNLSYPYYTWHLPLEKFCNKVITFDTRVEFFQHGKEFMNRKFLEVIEKEKPDYIFMIDYQELGLDTLLKIRKVSPKTQLFVFLSDDDLYYESSSLYLMLFADYGLAFQTKFLSNYNKDKISGVFSGAVTNTEFFKPLPGKQNTQKGTKRYDVTFVGSPLLEKAQRHEYIKFLKDNGINIKLFGSGWLKYQDLADICEGSPNTEEMLKVIHESRIYLCLSKSNQGRTTPKTKFFEGGAAGAFVLTEYCKDYLDDGFKEGKDIVMFKTKEELLRKILFYLDPKNKNKREKIAKAARARILKIGNIDIELKKIFNHINKTNPERKHRDFPKIKNKITAIGRKDFKLSKEKLKEKLKDYDTIYFKKGWSQNLKFREYLQAYSLEKTKKPISCCTYYAYSKSLGDYLYFLMHLTYRTFNREDFNSLLSMNQIMTTKEHFLKNFDTFKRAFKTGKIDFIDEKNTVFVSFPLVRIKNIKILNYELMNKAFKFDFLYKLYALKSQKKLLLSAYPYSTIWEIIKGKAFLGKAILKNLKDKDKANRLGSIKKT